jgi:ankyrin repeat protein
MIKFLSSKNRIMGFNAEDLFQIVRLHEQESYFKINELIHENISNSYGQTLIHEAVASANLEVLHDLISKRFNVNCIDNQGQTPLHYVANNMNVNTAQLLLEAGADINIKDDYGNNAMWTAVFNARGNYDLVNLFKRFSANSFSKNNNGKSAFDFATQINDLELIKLLS